jgi:hypothetical protein
MLCVKGMDMIVVKAGRASVMSCQLMSQIDSMKIRAPMRHRMGPVAMAGMLLKRGLQAGGQREGWTGDKDLLYCATSHIPSWHNETGYA